MRVEIINRGGEKLHPSDLRNWVQKVLRELKDLGVYPRGGRGGKLTLAFISREEMKNLNHKWRGKTRPTTILSFAPVEEGSLGELALCLPVIEQAPFLKTRQSLKTKSTGQDCGRTHWLHYLILHGILHLLGFDHEKDKKQARAMRRLQNQVFNKLTRP